MSNPFTSSPASGGSGWYYSDQDSLTRLLGVSNLAIESNLNGGTAANVAAIQADGEQSDSFINLRMRGMGWTTIPLTGMDADTENIFQYVSDLYTAFFLNEHRLLQTLAGSSLKQSDVDLIAAAYKKRADDILNGIASGTLVIVADGTPVNPDKAGGFENVTMNFGDEATEADENAA